SAGDSVGQVNKLAPFVQVGAFGREASALAMQKRVQSVVQSHPVFVGRAPHHDGEIFRVRVGPFSSQQEAERVRLRLDQAGIGKPLIITRSLQARHR
ncbi:MAG: SPOR domain-containing protein, partial [Oleiphilaceae bacterium]|nr:SPOR domain-containing protein [Oleiphilaceae bacterium]